MALHDIVVGDFGRQGTLRYLIEFSKAERELISAQLENGEFLDEYRRIRYTVIGRLREIKHKLVGRCNGQLDRSVLIGVRHGVSPHEILTPLLATVLPFIRLVANSKTERIRLILPCNTLGRLASTLQSIFDDRHDRKELEMAMGQNAKADLEWVSRWLREGGDIEVPGIPETVVGELACPSTRTLSILGSQESLFAYKQAVQKQRLSIAVQSYLPNGVQSFERLLIGVINGRISLKGIDPPAKNEVRICGCTDLKVPIIADSIRIFARHLVTHAYKYLS